jgi:hypothetical protein
VTEINGLRLAYRGFVTGLAAGYVWVAAAMVGAWLAGGSPLAPLHFLGGSGRDGLLAGIGVVQVGSAAIGMTFAYFFGRFFTVRSTLAVAGLCFGVLAWLIVAKVVDTRMGHDLGGAGLRIGLVAASALYGVMLGGAVPTRDEVLRHRAATTS